MTAFWPGNALADKRVALVIGNSAYTRVGKLPNTSNDAAAVANLLKASGFDVVDARRDLNANDMRRAIREFTGKVRDADIGVVFYAGHGMEVDGVNYLLPVDAALEQDIDIEDEAIPLDRIIRTLDQVKRLRLVILDACRDNPFSKTMKRTVASRSVGRGLAKIEPASSDTLIAFAAKAGSTASDGDSSNSPFTTALIKNVAVPGLDVRLAFGKIRDDVLASTNGKQEPFVYGSLGGTTVSLVPPPVPVKPVVVAPAAAPVVATPAINPANDIRRDYELAAQIGTKEAWGFFIANYPTGFYANLAQAARAKIVAEEAKLAAAAKAAETRAAEAKSAEAKAAAEAKATAATRAAAATEAKAVADAKVAEAKAAAEAKSAAAQAAADAKAAEPKNSAEAAAAKIVVASAPAATPDIPRSASPAGPDIGETTKRMQAELRRIGCYLGALNGSWDSASQHALEQFNKRAGLRLDVKLVSLDTVDVLKGKTTRICPLECDRGYRADKDVCVKIVCTDGQVLDDAGQCSAKKEKPRTASKPPESKAHETPTAAKPSGAGEQVFCGRAGCQAVPKNCRVEYASGVTGSGGGQVLKCN